MTFSPTPPSILFPTPSSTRSTARVPARSAGTRAGTRTAISAATAVDLDASRRSVRAAALVLGALALALVATMLGPAGAAFASPVAPVAPDAPADPTAPLQVTVDGSDAEPSTSLIVLVGLTVLSVAPSLLLMTTSFLKILVVLSLTRNALGLQGVPPNQVLSGIALFLSLFVMAPTVEEIRALAIDPYLAGETDMMGALGAATEPIRTFMLGHTREEDIALLTRAADMPNPDSPQDVDMSTLVPAFMLSELRSAFVIGFVIFIPFLVIDLVVGAVLMSVGMMMLPPVMISLPFKIMLMVLVDGWALIVTTLVGSYR